MRRISHLTIVVLFGVLAPTGCNRRDTTDDAHAAASRASGQGSVARAETAKTPHANAAEPVPSIRVGPRADADVFVYRMTGSSKKNTGWPIVEYYNQSNKPVTAFVLYCYAYDEAGKLLARGHTQVIGPGLAPGKHDDTTFGWGGEPFPPRAVFFDFCVDSVRFEGDADPNVVPEVRDGRCPRDRPLGATAGTE